MNRFFSCGPDNGTETHASAKAAKESAEESLQYFREESGDGWSEEAGNVFWGEIVQHSTQCDVVTAEEAKEHGDISFANKLEDNGWTYHCDYQLADVDPPLEGEEMTSAQKLAAWEAWARANEDQINGCIRMAAAHGYPYTGGAWPLITNEKTLDQKRRAAGLPTRSELAAAEHGIMVWSAESNKEDPAINDDNCALPGTNEMFGLRRETGPCPTSGKPGDRFLWRYATEGAWSICTVDDDGVLHRSPVDTSSTVEVVYHDDGFGQREYQFRDPSDSEQTLFTGSEFKTPCGRWMSGCQDDPDYPATVGAPHQWRWDNDNDRVTCPNCLEDDDA